MKVGDVEKYEKGMRKGVWSPEWLPHVPFDPSNQEFESFIGVSGTFSTYFSP